MQKDYILINGTLYHHGIKGQKWGERRWQNEDGSLTPAGREHYGYGEARTKLYNAKQAYRQAKRESNKAYNKAYRYSSYHPLTQFTGKKAKAESNKRWEDFYDKNKQEEQAKAALKKAKQEYKNSEEYKQAKDKAKKIAIAGAAVAATALAVYGGYKYVKATKEKAYKASYRKGAEAASRIMADVGMKNAMTSHEFQGAFKGFSNNIAKTAENNSKNFITSMKYLKGKGGQQSSAELARQGISTFNYGPYSEYMDKALDLYRNGINEDYIFGKKR